ncbi:mechanosensitive ion channel protein MscS [Picosynechococcus sp. PCC 7003]|uniref:mechanosensitive ion channel family protein n=1 Tax=Picosynechococcus sp. PCC 7003 TaxID=374981 RepID=UPI0008109B1E|nr:mechanosensitive ion channel family protein [Picosynechococcus sp. PCC 7003]ANV84854.1 mechanosensitive ion channel protein MscS [Picosynechococcus sp. PCC 7003]
MSTLFTSIANRLQNVFNLEVIGDQIAQGLINLVVALVTFAVFYGLWKIVDVPLYASFQKSKLDKTSARFLRTLVRYAILTFGAIQALNAVGINMAAIVTSLGLVGLTVGFAARDALSNLISGLLIFWDRPFVIDDLVEINGLYGRVETITLRSTRIVTVDGRMLAVPNSVVINSTVISYTNFPQLRLDIDVTVAVHENLDRVRQILLSLVDDHSLFADTPPAKVVVTALNDYNVALQLQVWLRNERTHISERFALREKVFTALTAAGIDMPFETIQLTPVAVQLQSEV